MTTLWHIFRDSFIQFWAIFGIFLAAGAVLTYLSRWTNNVLQQFRWPKATTYLFGLIGVPVHELSHAIFCKLFFHEVKKVKWFDANAKGGTHGAVEHMYRPWNLYQRIGHFFIGLGPTILGPFLLAVLFYALVPSARHVVVGTGLEATHGITTLGPFVSDLFHAIFNRGTLSSPGFYVFSYLAICICSQIELSPEDLKQVGTGVIPIFIALILGNVFAWSLGAQWHVRGLAIGTKILGTTLCLFAFAAIVSLCALLVCALIFGTINKLLGHEGINPFQVRTRSDKTLSRKQWTNRS